MPVDSQPDQQDETDSQHERDKHTALGRRPHRHSPLLQMPLVESLVFPAGAPTAVTYTGRPRVENMSRRQLSWKRSRVKNPGLGTPMGISNPNASKLTPACATISAYSIGGTPTPARA